MADLAKDMAKLDIEPKKGSQPAAATKATTTTKPAAKTPAAAPAKAMTPAQKAAAAQKAAQAQAAAKKQAAANKKAAKEDAMLNAMMAESEKTASTQGATHEQCTAASLKVPLTQLEQLDKHLARKLGHRPDDYVIPTITKDGETITQTSPPSIPVSTFWAEAAPEGIWVDCKQTTDADKLDTITATSAKKNEKVAPQLPLEDLLAMRQAADVHKQVRQSIVNYIQPGVRLLDIAAQLERSVLELVGYDPTNPTAACRGFPTGLNVSNLTTGVANVAHWAPNPGDRTVVHKDDVIKIDFGVQKAGRIIDSAFTWHMNEQFDPIVEATKEATRHAIAMAGVDVRLGDIGGIVSEIITSYEVELTPGNLAQVKPIINLFGHNILPYKIHGGKSVPLYNNHDQTKMLEGEVFAIETFAGVNTTGKQHKVSEGPDCSHFMKEFSMTKSGARSQQAMKLYNAITKEFGTLAFCPRWLIEAGQENTWALGLNELCRAGSINPYPPLVLPKGTHSSQNEHTIVIGPKRTEVVSGSWDY